MRVLLTGGGTGGHIYPGLAVAEALLSEDRSTEILFVGSSNGMEAGIVPAVGLRFEAIPARKLRKVFSPDTLLVAASLLRGYQRCRRVIADWRPDVVVGTGGFVAGSAVLAGVAAGIPTVIHEQNAEPGRTNGWLARRVRTVCVSFPETIPLLRARRTELTGLPVRTGVVATQTRSEAREALGIPVDRFTVLLIGGSQGAVRLNEIAWDTAVAMGDDVQWVMQTGSRWSPPTSLPGCLARAFVQVDELALWYRAADLAVTRCGASTLAELAANSLPALLVPLPTAYADHQSANARCMERAGGGILMPQVGLTAEALSRQIRALRSAGLAEMSAAAGAMARPNAARDIAGIARELGG